MDDVFNNAFESGKETAGQVAAEQVEKAETVEQVAEQPEGSAATESATTAQENGKHVPLAALEAERKGRQDWKEKAIRYEEELKAIRQRPEPAQQPAQEVSPLERVQQEMVTQRFNMSEQIARTQYKDATDLEDMVMLCANAAAQNPVLQAQLAASAHPWDFAYKEGKRLKLMQDMGDNPEDFEAKIRAKILAELQGNGQAPAPAPVAAAPSAPQLPQSLATARSSAGRAAPTFTGPTPIGSLFEN